MNMFIPGQHFRHKDGGLYQFIGLVKYTDRPTQGVHYYHLWPFEPSHWIRPIEEWTEDRFTPITPQEVDLAMNEPREIAQEKIKANKAARK